VANYFDLLEKQNANEPFIKAHVYRDLAQQTGRTASSIEFKFQNISAVLNEMGLDWLTGLAPLANFQKLLAETINEYEDRVRALATVSEPKGLEDLAGLFVESPPERAIGKTSIPEYMEKLVRKFDPVERDRKNRLLGEAGEEIALEYEKRCLHAIERHDLAKNVRWVSKIEGDGAGYDILSFDGRGEKKFIEVKTTIGSNTTPFFISRNEFDFSKRETERFRLFRVFDFRKSPRAFELQGPLENFVRLSTETFRADFRA
tara:strand:- start:320 stop:1099 length:780 start_codon:yes stop_codon:yes gene_type:complete